MLKIETCNVFDLEKQTGICPRNSWIYKKANKNVYYVQEDSRKITAFMRKTDAIKFVKNLTQKTH